MRVLARTNVALSGWPRGEIRDVDVDGRTLRRVEEGTLTVVEYLTVVAPPAEPDPDGEWDGET